ncbi:TPA: hypothetical protein DCR49_05620 [Candidatus Delongbacteria bacterium]|nr:hypothetical protein [Candidatus Delongbacteria bacterium]
MDENLELQKNREFEIPLSDLIIILWRNRIVIISITLVFALVSIIYSLVVDEQFQVTCLLNPSEPSSEILLNPNATFSGFSFDKKVETPVVKLIHLNLDSRDFLLNFYEKYSSNKAIFGDRMLKIRDREDLTEEEKELHMKDKFIEIMKSEVIQFSINSINNIVQISVKSTDKYLAYDLLNEIILRLKIFIKEQNVNVLKDEIEFYTNILSEVSDIKIQNSINQLLADKIRKSFEISSSLYSVVESPFVPSQRIFPKRKIIVVALTAIGFFVSIVTVFSLPFVSNLKKKLKENA